MQYYDINPAKRRFFNDEYMKAQYSAHTSETFFKTPEYRRKFVAFFNRQVTERFFADFFITSDRFGATIEFGGWYRHEFFLDSGENASWRIQIDENKRIIDIGGVCVWRNGEPYDDPHVDSDRIITPRIYRKETVDEINEFIQALESYYTVPRAESMLGLLKDGKSSCGTDEFIIEDKILTICDLRTGQKMKIPMEQVKMLMEWSFTYLECFYMPHFITSNVPGFEDNIAYASCLLRFMRIFDPRSYYDYSHIYDATIRRARNFSAHWNMMMDLYDGAFLDVWIEQYKKFIDSCLTGKIGIIENRENPRRALYSY